MIPFERMRCRFCGFSDVYERTDHFFPHIRLPSYTRSDLMPYSGGYQEMLEPNIILTV